MARNATRPMIPILLVLCVAACHRVGVGIPAADKAARRQQGRLVLERIPPIPQQISDRLLQYQNVRGVRLHDWDPARGGILIATRFGDTNQLHYVAQAGGARQQITFFREPVAEAAMCPVAERHGLLFTKDIGGNETYQVFYHDLATARHRMLTDGTSRHGAVSWSRDGQRFAYYGTQRNGKDWDIYVADPDQSTQARRVLAEGGSWVPVDWSPDDAKLLVQKYVSINESYVYVLTVSDGKLEPINPSSKTIAYGDVIWTADGAGVYYTADEGGEFLQLYHYALSSKQPELLTGDIPWDVVGLELSADGGQLAFVVNAGGIDQLYLLNTKSRTYSRVPGIPLGQIDGLRWHSDGRLAVALNRPTAPADVYVLDSKTRRLQRWTFSEVGGLSTSRLVEPSLIEYETFDRVDGRPRKIPAFYYRPKGQGPHPVLISIHGGPEGQYVPRFWSDLQYYVNEMGIAVLAPNVRGSSGYGKSYLLLDNGFKREDSVKDIGALLDWIAAQPELDSERVAVRGGSYGGYMVLASMVHYNDRLRAGVELVGISNFVTFLKNTKDYRRDLRRAEYGDERDPKMREHLERISPTNNASEINRPLFVAQGQNDPRVPVTESEQMVAEIRKNGGTVWYLLAQDEGHGFRKKTNRDVLSQSVVLFLQRYLLP